MYVFSVLMKDRYESCVDSRCRLNRRTNLVTLIRRKKAAISICRADPSGAQPFVGLRRFFRRIRAALNTGRAEER